jgi:hypothetical protein
MDLYWNFLGIYSESTRNLLDTWTRHVDTTQHLIQMSQQSRLGLKQTPAGPKRVRAPPKAPPKRDGPVWATVTVLVEHATSPSLQCLNCGAKFCGGATRICEHILGGGHIAACTCETDNFLDLKQKMMEKKEDTSASKRQKAAAADVDAVADRQDDGTRHLVGDLR